MSPARRRDSQGLLEPPESEASAVRERSTLHAQRTEAPPGDKIHRLEVKVALAHALVRSLPPAHEIRRLLAIAVIRRDELLVDGILRRLSGERDLSRT